MTARASRKRKDDSLGHRAHVSGCTRPRRIPPPPDLRAGSLPDVQLIAGVGPFELDVLVRVLPDARLDVVGQVTGAARVHEPVCGLALLLFDAERMEAVASTETDHFGEFVLAGLPESRYVLALGATRKAPCVEIWEGDRRAATCKTPV